MHFVPLQMAFRSRLVDDKDAHCYNGNSFYKNRVNKTEKTAIDTKGYEV